jgi:hypothetical protein
MQVHGRALTLHKSSGSQTANPQICRPRALCVARGSGVRSIAQHLQDTTPYSTMARTQEGANSRISPSSRNRAVLLLKFMDRVTTSHMPSPGLISHVRDPRHYAMCSDNHCPHQAASETVYMPCGLIGPSPSKKTS